MPLYYATMSLKGLFITHQQDKTLNNQNASPRICNAMSVWAPLGFVGQPISHGRNSVILSFFGAYDTLLERPIWVLKYLYPTLTYGYGPIADPKKCHLGGKNHSRSSRLEKLLKIVNVEINKETNEINWRPIWNRKVATNIHLDQLPTRAWHESSNVEFILVQCVGGSSSLKERLTSKKEWQLLYSTMVNINLMT